MAEVHKNSTSVKERNGANRNAKSIQALKRNKDVVSQTSLSKRSVPNNIGDTNLDVSLRMNAKNGAMAPGTKVSKLPHLMGHKQQAKTSLKAPNRKKTRVANQQMMVGSSESAGLD